MAKTQTAVKGTMVNMGVGTMMFLKLYFAYVVFPPPPSDVGYLTYLDILVEQISAMVPGNETKTNRERIYNQGGAYE